MSKEEAIKTLYEYRHCFWDKLYEPICMAINALTAIEEIKADIDNYLIQEGFGSEYRSDVKRIIDKHISGEENE